MAPIIIEELLAAIRRVLRGEGLSAIIVEQHARKIPGITDHAIVLERGAAVHRAASRDLKEDAAALERHTGVAARKAGPQRASA